MPSHCTFQIKPINELIWRYIGNGGLWADPFARNSPFNKLCAVTNDLNPEAKTTHHMEALNFLQGIDSASMDGVLFDPPYSPRQISECYKGVGREVHMEDTQISFYTDRKNEVSRILRPSGVVICFGWNSNGAGKKNGFDLEEVLLVAHGSAHNDTIVTVERKTKGLFDQ